MAIFERALNRAQLASFPRRRVGSRILMAEACRDCLRCTSDKLFAAPPTKAGVPRKRTPQYQSSEDGALLRTLGKTRTSQGKVPGGPIACASSSPRNVYFICRKAGRSPPSLMNCAKSGETCIPPLCQPCLGQRLSMVPTVSADSARTR